MNATELNFDLKGAKKVFSRIGLALILFFVATYASQMLLFFALELFFPSFSIATMSYSTLLVISMVTMYLIGFPVFYLCVRPLKTEAPTRFKTSFGTLAITVLITFALSYVGQIMGEMLYFILFENFGIDFSSESLDIVASLTWYEALISVCIISPFFEELMFRKIIIDRTKMYGEKLSMFFSAITFALFHASLLQFFYAFFIGLLFSYLYLRRGSFFSCWILHAIFNFFGSVVPLILFELVDIDAFLSTTDIEVLYKLVEENLFGYTLFALYSFALLGLTIAGTVMFFVKKKNVRFYPSSLQLPKDTEGTVAFTNIGMVAFILFSIIYPIVTSYF